ncbi:APC family permease [Arthrobacter mobilis]|uniref:APC family permease n=1 Tax=Arthrobacter mobilis TaxID=2724944 RepID=A0A7X6HEL7_9MICC|nr:APC family permease [Arthrobacter mobilis]NKX55729.1 APC family permease [Arthrobacter mobilis]
MNKNTPSAGTAAPPGRRASGLSAKGLGAGTVGLAGATVIGVSAIAPAYTLTGALGPAVAEVGAHLPGILLIGFIPMLLVAFGYRELNRAMPDSGTSFTWAARAFGPWVGWMAGWGLCAATIIVLSNLAGIAVDFFYLLLSQLTGNADLASLAANPLVNVATCLAFMLAATWVSCRDMQTTQKLQYWLVGFQILVMVGFGVAALVRLADGSAFDPTPIQAEWFNPFGAGSASAVVAGLSLTLFMFWGWDVTLTMSEETKGSSSTPGRAATLTMVVIVGIYLLVSVALLAFAGTGSAGVGLGNPEIQGNVFFALAGPVMGPLAVLVSIAVLSSSASSLQSTFVSPARTLLAMGHYGALPARFASVSKRFSTPVFATVVSSLIASTFYAVMRLVSEDVLWDTITALGVMVCFYYGLTAYSCVWYFRKQWTASIRSFFFTLLFPLTGAVVLTILFFTTLIDSMDPAYGSGSSVFGVGLVFILAVVVLLSGAVVMFVQARRRPDFFHGLILPRGAAGAARAQEEELEYV